MYIGEGPFKIIGGDTVEDEKIVELYWARSEDAIKQTDIKYGSYCRRIAMNILSSELDAEECVNDAYLRAWEAIPPHRPERLSAFLGKITRNISLNRYARDHAQRRVPTVEAVYEELSELIPDTAESIDDERELAEAINHFLASLPQKSRIIFIQRYWYLCSVKEIAKNRGLTESNVKVILMRTRKMFKEYLTKEGITV